MDLLVTDYSKDIFKKPIKEVEFFSNKELIEDDLGNLDVHGLKFNIFERLPIMRDIPSNKSWFEGFIISKS